MALNPYETLGLTSSATQDQIKAAYRKLAKKFHPDLNPKSKKAEDRFKDISVAYDLVSSPAHREKYDKGEADKELAREARVRRGSFHNETHEDGARYTNDFSGMDDEDISSIFERMGHQRKRNKDELYQLEIEFVDSILGAEHDITLPSGKKFRVKIPAGVTDGAKLRFPGRAKSGADVYVQLTIKTSPTFTRTGNNLESQADVSLSDAILGGEISVPTIEGNIVLKIPPNVSFGQRMRVGNKGVPISNGKRGAQIIKLNIIMPKTVDAEFRQALIEWRQRNSATKDENR